MRRSSLTPPVLPITARPFLLCRFTRWCCRHPVIREKITKSFQTNALVPTDSNGFSPGKEVAQAPGRLREVLSGDDLSFFSEKKYAVWAKGVTQGTRSDLFLKSLGTGNWAWTDLECALDKKFGFGADPDFEWLDRKPDAWMQKFYLLLGEAIKKECFSGWEIKDWQIIRVSGASGKTHVAGNNSYFPKSRYKDLPKVKQSILRCKSQQATKKIVESLRALGVSEIGDEEQIKLLLKTFYRDDSSGVSKEQNLEHMLAFIKWWKKKEDASEFDECTIFFAEGSDVIQAAKACYIDSPLHKSGLDAIYKDKACPLSPKAKLWSGYKKLLTEGFLDFAVACGAANGLSITNKGCNSHPNKKLLMKDYFGYRIKFTNTGINNNFTITGLPSLIKMKKRDVSLLIWDTVCKAKPEFLEAEFRPNQQYDLRSDKSSLVLALSKAEWIPDKRGTLKKPADISKENLHKAFKYDNRNGWLDEIGFGENAKKETEEFKIRKEMATKLGIPLEIAEHFSRLPEEEHRKETKEMLGFLKKKEDERKKRNFDDENRVSYPEALTAAFSTPGETAVCEPIEGAGRSNNAARRRSKIKEELSIAIENEGKSGDRCTLALRKKWKGKNDVVRSSLAAWYGGKCQICNKTFTQRSGEPYFEGVYLVPRASAEWLDRVGNVLCLCPWHSAQFQYGERQSDDSFLQSIIDIKSSDEGGDEVSSVVLRLCGQTVQIKFADKHILDLQEMIKLTKTSF